MQDDDWMQWLTYMTGANVQGTTTIGGMTYNMTGRGHQDHNWGEWPARVVDIGPGTYLILDTLEYGREDAEENRELFEDERPRICEELEISIGMLIKVAK